MALVEIIWDCVVKEEQRGNFNLLFGPGGEWSRLFSGQPGYRGTTVLSDLQNAQRFLVVDLWDSLAVRDHVLADQKTAYSILLDKLHLCCETITSLGTFQLRAEATVRPKPRPRSWRS